MTLAAQGVSKPSGTSDRVASDATRSGDAHASRRPHEVGPREGTSATSDLGSDLLAAELAFEYQKDRLRKQQEAFDRKMLALLQELERSFKGSDEVGKASNEPVLVVDAARAAYRGEEQVRKMNAKPNRPLCVVTSRQIRFQHAIELEKDAKPVKIPLGRYSATDRAVIKAFVDEGLKSGMIEKSNSAWSAAIAVVSDTNGQKSVTVSYSHLNAVTEEDAVSPLRIDETLDQLRGSKYFSVVTGVWPVGMKESSKEYTAFSTPEGLYHFKAMPLRLRNANATLQRTAAETLASVLGKKAVVYIGTVCIYSPTVDQHVQDVLEVLELLDRAGFAIDKGDCQFGKTQVALLGRMVDGQGVRAHPDKVEAVRTRPEPTDKKGLQRFLGTTGFHHHFVPDYARVSRPLTLLTRGKLEGKIKLTPEARRAFAELKCGIAESKMLHHPDSARRFWLETHASEFAVGAVLSQVRPDSATALDPRQPPSKNELQPIAYYSKQLTDAQSRYSDQERRMLSVLLAVKRFARFVDNAPAGLMVITDRQSARCFRREKLMTDRQKKFVEQVERFKLAAIVYRRP